MPTRRRQPTPGVRAQPTPRGPGAQPRQVPTAPPPSHRPGPGGGGRRPRRGDSGARPTPRSSSPRGQRGGGGLVCSQAAGAPFPAGESGPDAGVRGVRARTPGRAGVAPPSFGVIGRGRTHDSGSPIRAPQACGRRGRARGHVLGPGTRVGPQPPSWGSGAGAAVPGGAGGEGVAVGRRPRTRMRQQAQAGPPPALPSLARPACLRRPAGHQPRRLPSPSLRPSPLPWGRSFHLGGTGTAPRHCPGPVLPSQACWAPCSPSPLLLLFRPPQELSPRASSWR